MAKKKDQDQPAEEMKITYRRLDTIKPLPGNAKLHAIDDIAKSIVTNGFIDPLGINIVTGHDMDGNGRLEALKMLYVQGEPPPKNIRAVKEKINDDDVTVWYAPTVDLEFDTETEPIVALALNRLNEKGGYDTAAVLAILEQAKAFGRLEETGYDADAMAGILARCAEIEGNGAGGGQNDGTAVDAEPQIDRAAELNEKWQVKTGDLWLIGEHRLLCGDSTKAKDVVRVMDGEEADLLVTDPPYNVGYVGKTKEALTIDNDEMPDPAFRDFLVKAFDAAFASLKAGGGYYIWHADLEGYNFRGAIFDIGQRVRQCLIWAKNTLVMGRQDYHWKHEPCLYGWKEGAAHSWHSDRTQTTVLQFDRPTRSQEHPTMKPTALFQYLIGNSSGKGEIILDTFGGSGTTLVAAQNMGRKGRTVELSPDYCAVILERMSTAFPDLAIKKA